MKLHLVLKAKWFDMIKSGEKKEEYRNMTDYWHKRIGNRADEITSIVFHRGYTNITHEREVEKIDTGFGNPEWGDFILKKQYRIRLGKEVK